MTHDGGKGNPLLVLLKDFNVAHFVCGNIVADFRELFFGERFDKRFFASSFFGCEGSECWVFVCQDIDDFSDHDWGCLEFGRGFIECEVVSTYIESDDGFFTSKCPLWASFECRERSSGLV